MNTLTSRRNVVPKGLLWIFLDMWRANTDFPDDDDPIFVKMDGSSILSFAGSFRQLLNDLDMPENEWGRPFSLYSLRTSYATHALQRNPGSAWQIAKNMGHHDVEMLTKHYGQDTSVDHADDLSEWR